MGIPARCAQPGDPDLDLDVDCVVISEVVRLGDEFVVTASGGFGRWSQSGDMVDVDRVTSVELAFGFGMAPGFERFVDIVAERLLRWREEGTLLRMCSAPGRWSTLIEDVSSWVPVPRTD